MDAPDIEVVNVVAGGTVDTELDIEQLAADAPLPTANYDPSFNATFLRCQEDGPLLIVYTSGSYILRGVSSYGAVEETMNSFLDTLTEMGVPLGEPTTSVRNVVATASFDITFDLTTLVAHLGFEHTEYEPEQFPGLVYRPPDSGCVLLIFATGNVVITGGVHPDDNRDALASLAVDLTHT